MMPRTKSDWKSLACELAAAAVVLAFVGGCFGFGAVLVARAAACLVGGV